MPTKKILLGLATALTLSFSFFGLLAPAGASPDPKATNFGITAAANAANLKLKVAGQKNIFGVIGVIVGLALSAVAVIFFILILYAGFTWMTALGNSERVGKAKQLLETSIIGLVIVLAANAIAQFVFRYLLK